MRRKSEFATYRLRIEGRSVNILFDALALLRVQGSRFEGNRVHHTVRHHRLVSYHRPTALGDAVALLAEPDRLIYAGGTTIHHSTTGEAIEVVDLQALDLDRIESAEADDRTVRLGATATLQAISEHDGIPDAIRDAARAELPSTLRTLATVGGTIGAAEADSRLLASLLVHDAEVSFADGHVASLDGVLAARSSGSTDLTASDQIPPGLTNPGLIVAVEIGTDGATATAATGRTPADTPIVAATARRADGGLRLALCGVADVPILVVPDDVTALDPPSDFRGSSTYRRELAKVLAARVVEELS
jgi:CO/xanthine dehydrogenase FAD-binding subunit